MKVERQFIDLARDEASASEQFHHDILTGLAVRKSIQRNDVLQVGPRSMITAQGEAEHVALGAGGTGVLPVRSHVADTRGSGNFCGVESMLSGMSAVRFSHVTDGLSQTLLQGERVTIPPSISSAPFTSGWYGILTSQTNYVFSSMPYTQATAAFPINSAMGSPQNFSSRHVGGANFALGDGSVRFMSENIDGALFEALGTRNGQEVVEF